MRIGGLLADGNDQACGLAQFILAQMNIADEAMHMGDEGGHDFAQSRILRLLHHREHGWGDIAFMLDHGVALQRQSVRLPCYP